MSRDAACRVSQGGEKLRDKFTVALIQMSCGPEPADNLAKALDRVAEAARKGAHVVCLQELFQFAVFLPARKMPRLFDLAEPIPGPGLRRSLAVRSPDRTRRADYRVAV
jgi:N-carbamoylputrescine amidase